MSPALEHWGLADPPPLPRRCFLQGLDMAAAEALCSSITTNAGILSALADPFQDESLSTLYLLFLLLLLPICLLPLLFLWKKAAKAPAAASTASPTDGYPEMQLPMEAYPEMRLPVEAYQEVQLEYLLASPPLVTTPMSPSSLALPQHF